jgi:cytochrome P450
MPSIVQIISLSAVCLAGYWLYWELTTGRRRRQLITKNGCKPIQRVKTIDPFLGLDALLKMWRWYDQHMLLEKSAELFFGSGRQTVEFNFLGFMAILSTEAENLKAVFSQQFRLFKMPTGTKELDLLLHGGIFLNEGEAWHQSRELIRPSFARSQVADLEMLERQVSMLIDKVPRDGSTVDLTTMFAQLTLSVAISFLFGESSNEVVSDAEEADKYTFNQTWNRVSVYLASRGERKHGVLWVYNFLLDLVRMNPRHKRNCRKIHGRHDMFLCSTFTLLSVLLLTTINDRLH